VLLRVRFGRIPSGKQLSQCLLRAHVLHLEQFEIRFRLNRGGYRQEAVETPRIVGSVVVLRSAIHNARPPFPPGSGFLDGMHQ
jgi:hypothetical protein